MTDIAEITRLAEKATPGLWREGIDGNQSLYGPDNSGTDSGLIASFVRRRDLSYIAAASPTAWLAMAKRCEAYRDALAKISEQKKTDELETVNDVEFADFEQGYDDIIDIARKVLGEDTTT